MIPVGIFVPTIWAGTHNVAVGEKLLRLLVEILLRGLLDELAGIVELGKESAGNFGVGAGRRTRIHIKRHFKIAERVANQGMVFINDLLRRNAFFLGANGNGHAVLVGAANKFYVTPYRAQVAHINIGRQINARQVANVHWAIGIGQSSRNGVALRNNSHTNSERKRHAFTFILKVKQHHFKQTQRNSGKKRRIKSTKNRRNRLILNSFYI